MKALAVYDWLLTSSDEIRIIWRRRVTGAKVLFILNRYSILGTFLTLTLSTLMYGPTNAVSVRTWRIQDVKSHTFARRGVLCFIIGKKNY